MMRTVDYHRAQPNVSLSEHIKQKRLQLGSEMAKKYKIYLDFHHAAAAIGYCDLFLTEKALKTLVSQNHLGLKEDFPCIVESSAIDGLRVLNDRF